MPEPPWSTMVPDPLAALEALGECWIHAEQETRRLWLVMRTAPPRERAEGLRLYDQALVIARDGHDRFHDLWRRLLVAGRGDEAALLGARYTDRYGAVTEAEHLGADQAPGFAFEVGPVPHVNARAVGADVDVDADAEGGAA